MEWGALLPALLGTVVGGTITIVGQALTDGRRDRAAVGAEDRAAHRAQVDRQRVQVRELHDLVSEDTAYFRTSVLGLDDAVNLERADGLEPVSKEVSARHDRAASLIAVVPDASVRSAADAVYETWGRWLAGEVAAMVGGHANQVSANEVLATRAELATTVRRYLGTLEGS